MKVISYVLELDVFIFCQISLVFKRLQFIEIFLFCFSYFINNIVATFVELQKKQTKGKKPHLPVPSKSDYLYLSLPLFSLHHIRPSLGHILIAVLV